jgi:hypothetical protein
MDWAFSNKVSDETRSNLIIMFGTDDYYKMSLNQKDQKKSKEFIIETITKDLYQQEKDDFPDPSTYALSPQRVQEINLESAKKSYNSFSNNVNSLFDKDFKDVFDNLETTRGRSEGVKRETKNITLQDITSQLSIINVDVLPIADRPDVFLIKNNTTGKETEWGQGGDFESFKTAVKRVGVPEGYSQAVLSGGNLDQFKADQ